MALKDTSGNWIDGAGQPIPAKYVDKVAKKRDAVVAKIVKKALAEEARLMSLKKDFMAEIDGYLDWLVEVNGTEALNDGGNYKLSGFSQDMRVTLKVQKFLDLDERIHIVKQKLDDCLTRWSQGGNNNLKAVVFEAFKVDQQGRFDTMRVLSLRRLKIDDKVWREAMELLTDAISVSGTKAYIVIEERKDRRSEWRTVRMNFNGLPEAA